VPTVTANLSGTGEKIFQFPNGAKNDAILTCVGWYNGCRIYCKWRYNSREIVSDGM